MADRDTSTSLSTVTRRRLTAGTLTAAIMSLAHRSLEAQSPPIDPALSLWHEWRAAHARAAMLCRVQQRLETELADTVGFPHAMAEIPNAATPTMVFALADLDDLFVAVPGAWPVRAKAEAELLDHQARWDRADQRLGYSAAKQAEEDTEEQARHLAEALWATPAGSLLGVAGKLDAVLALGQSGEDCEEFPWPQLRSTLGDLVRIGCLAEFQNRYGSG